MIKIIAIATGLAAVLGLGSILLSSLGNNTWPVFLFAAIFVFLIGILVKKI
ncbi:MAG: hypothetical protein NTU57_05410 [Candidatus Aenigmarchaeota archaeon]|nr:hypothetical protein [Candidatus Aenigmarchaeota archaeon]